MRTYAIDWAEFKLHTSDAIVVGGGIVGRSVALGLARKGLKVLVLELDLPDSRQATRAAGAMLGAFCEYTLNDPPPESDKDLAVRVRAAERYSSWLTEFSDRVSVPQIQRGTMLIASAVNRHDNQNLRAIVSALRTFNARYEVVDYSAIKELSPASHQPISEVIWLPDEGSINVLTLADALLAELTLLPNVEVKRQPALRLLGPSERVTGVEVASGKLYAGWIILACGVGMNDLAKTHPGAADHLPSILESKGTSLVLEIAEPLPFVIRTPNREFACGIHLVPRGGRHAYLGATNRVSSVLGATGSARVDEVHYLLESAFSQINSTLAHANVVSVTSGSRPVSADGRPAVGITSLSGLAIASGTYRNGVLLSPLIGDLVCCEILHERTADDNPFSMTGNRFSSEAGELDMRTVFHDAASDFAATFLEPAGVLPYGRSAELSGLLEALLWLASESQEEAVIELRKATLGRYPMAEIIPELLIVLSKMRQDSPPHT